jgi:hypothetical protein
MAGLLHAGSATGSGASVFALHGEGGLPAPLAALGMGGIWNSEVVPTSRTTFVSWIGLALLVVLAVAGWRRWVARPDSGRLVALWLTGFGVALLTWLLPTPVDWFAGHVPGGGLLRDGTRTFALCLPAYACLPAVGVEVLAGRLSHGETEVRRLVAVAGALLPVILLYDAAWGLSGALRPVDYPASWAETRAAVDLGQGDLLVLPEGAYRAPAWNHDRTVLDPLGRYLPPDYVADDALVVDGSTVPGEDPDADWTCHRRDRQRHRGRHHRGSHDRGRRHPRGELLLRPTRQRDGRRPLRLDAVAAHRPAEPVSRSTRVGRPAPARPRPRSRTSSGPT